jgi:lipopolysaccharide biosynthesis glycosyltransferase
MSKNIIYQYWDGDLRPGVEASVKNIAEYAERIGVEHRFEHNPAYFKNRIKGNEWKYYGAFRPVYDTDFDEYDKVLFLDCDIFAVDGLEENIFDQLTGDIAMCTEPFQPKQRVITKGQITSARDTAWAKLLKESWNVNIPRTEDGLVKVWNSGVVLYSKVGRMRAREYWTEFNNYIDVMKSNNQLHFYALDQNYLTAMIFYANMSLQEMDNDWNCYIHFTHDVINPNKRLCDWRTPTSKFVHTQGAGLDQHDAETLHRVVNRPVEEWGFYVPR